MNEENKEPYSPPQRRLISKLNKDKTIKSWKFDHDIVIPYKDEDSILRGYKPDFLIEKTNGTKEIIDLVSKQLDFEARTKGSKKWCESKGIKFKVIEY